MPERRYFASETPVDKLVGYSMGSNALGYFRPPLGPGRGTDPVDEITSSQDVIQS